MNLAKLGISLIVVVVLAGCSSYSGAYQAPATNTAAAPCGPCAPQQPVCDPCAPQQPVCNPCATAPIPTDPCGTPPPSANAGEVWCYVRVPAVTQTLSEQVCVQPETCRQEWVPPVTREVCEQVCTSPEQVNRIPVPAKYETVCDQVMVCPSKTEWRKVACEPHNLSEGEQLGECWTLCEVPPVYETRSRQVCVQPETCREEIIPARYESRTKTVTDQEGYYKSIPVPAVYETRCREECVSPSRWEWRRTHECEVPDVTGAVCPPCATGGGMAPAPAPYSPPAMDMDSGFESMPMPPDETLPPAGTLPPADPFIR